MPDADNATLLFTTQVIMDLRLIFTCVIIVVYAMLHNIVPYADIHLPMRQKARKMQTQRKKTFLLNTKISNEQ